MKHKSQLTTSAEERESTSAGWDAPLRKQVQCKRLLGLPLLMGVRLDWNMGGGSGDVNGHGRFHEFIA